VTNHNFRITVTRSRTAQGTAETEPNLQFRFDRQQNQIIVTVEPLKSTPSVYRASVDLEREILLFTDRSARLNAKQLAEKSICQNFLGITP
jgi:hypothetical protein